MKLTLKDISLATARRDKGLAKRTSQSKVIGTRSRKNFKRFIFHVKSSMLYSSKQGHLVSIIFPNIKISELKENKALKPCEQRVRIHCTCPAWGYWGSAYHSTHFKYNIDGKIETRAPKENDPKTRRLICKHVYAVYNDIKNDNFIRLYNRFKKAYYRKRDKTKVKKSQSAEDSILLFIYQHLKNKGFSHKFVLAKINELRKNDLVEEYLLEQGLIV